MKKNQNENIEVVETVEATEVVEEVVEESKAAKLGAKAARFIKKHGLKVVAGVGAAVGAGILIVRALRKGDEEAALEYLGESDDYEENYLEELEDSNVTTEE